MSGLDSADKYFKIMPIDSEWSEAQDGGQKRGLQAALHIVGDQHT